MTTQVQFPDLDDAGPLSAGFDVLLGRLTGFEIAYGEDDASCVETDEMPGCFEAETDIGAGDDDGAVGEGLCGIRGSPEELGVDHAHVYGVVVVLSKLGGDLALS